MSIDKYFSFQYAGQEADLPILVSILPKDGASRRIISLKFTYI